MSDFSDFLERLIQEDGYSVYGFAQEAGVDRPTLHRVLKGQLVPRLLIRKHEIVQ